jgi:subtilisin family serine protease
MLGVRSAAWAGDASVGAIVKLAIEPVVTYGGGIKGLAATSRAAANAPRLDPDSRAVRAYRAHVARVQDDFEATLRRAIPTARVMYRYDMVIGGVAVTVPEAVLETLRYLPGVVSVTRDEGRPFITDKSPGFIGAPKLWGKLGGPANAGEGVIIGIIDSGIWPEHPSFADPDPKGKPYVAPPGTRTCDFDIGASPGPAFACNGKIIGAYRFMAAYDACGSCFRGRFSSARDSNGHGSATAGVAAGNRAVKAQLGAEHGVLSGIAPRAHIVIYKTGEFINFVADTVAAIQQAILDGVDVINFSIHGHANPYLNPTDLAFRDAVAAGIFVAGAVANDGPAPSSATQLAGWVTSAGASSQRRDLRSKVTLKANDGAKLKVQGRAITGAIKDAPILFAPQLGDPACLIATPDAAYAGAVVVCRSEQISAEQQALNVAARGAVGLLVYTDVPGNFGSRAVSSAIPLVAIDVHVGPSLVAFLTAHPGGTVAITTAKTVNQRGDVVTSFSSRGGPALTLGISKPDLSAPGEGLVAAMTPEPDDPRVRSGQLFNVWQGTSFAAPHVAGAAALLRQQHPTWTPGQLQSALMTTATTKDLVDSDEVTPATPFDVGSGRIQLKLAMDPGLTFAAPVQDFFDHAADLWTVNYPSLYVPAPAPVDVSVERTATSTLAKDSVWSLTVASPPDLLVTVPPTLAVAAGGTASFAIGVDKTALGPGMVRHARLTLAHKKYRVQLPITAVGDVALPDLVVTAFSVSSPLESGNSFTVTLTAANQGTANAPPFFVSLALSADITFSADDSYFASCTYASGQPAATSGACSFTDAYGASVAPGTYHVLALADSEITVVERDEANNVTVMLGTVEVQ